MTIDLQRLVAVLLIAVVLLVCAWVVADYVTSARLQGTLADLKADGFATSLAGAAPAAIPEAQNAAPLYLKAFEKLAAARELDVTIPPVEKGGFGALSADDKNKVRDWLAANAETLGLFSSARARGRCRFDRDYSKGMATPVPEAAQAIKAAKILSYRAQALAEDGKPDAARKAILDAFALADSMKDDPIFVVQLVRIVIVSMHLKVVDHCVGAEAGEAELKSWLDLTPTYDHLNGLMETGFRGDLASIAELAGKPLDRTLAAWVPGNPFVLGGGRVAFRPILRNDLTTLIDLLTRATTACRRPIGEAIESLQALEKEAESLPGWLYPLTRTFIPALSKAVENQRRVIATLAVVRAGLECELAHAARKHYPEKLDVVDPFTGKPLVYNPDKGLLYSFGPDGDDDGGEELKADAGGDQVGDIVWKLRRRH